MVLNQEATTFGEWNNLSEQESEIEQPLIQEDVLDISPEQMASLENTLGEKWSQERVISIPVASG